MPPKEYWGCYVDLKNKMSYAILDAYYDMNLPQPILSLKLHQNTPDSLYESIGRFFFTPGCLTPSIFNDDSMFEVLRANGVDENDLEDYSIAGCQEPLIMGKDNGNTTNSWLNLAKILELTLNEGVSTITGKKIVPSMGDPKVILCNIKEVFYQHVALTAERTLCFYCKKRIRTIEKWRIQKSDPKRRLFFSAVLCDRSRSVAAHPVPSAMHGLKIYDFKKRAFCTIHCRIALFCV